MKSFESPSINPEIRLRMLKHDLVRAKAKLDTMDGIDQRQTFFDHTVAPLIAESESAIGSLQPQDANSLQDLVQEIQNLAKAATGGSLEDDGIVRAPDVILRDGDI